MSQLKPMIIVLLMLTSTLAGCTGTDTTDLEQQIADLQQSNDEMNETINQQNEDNADLQSQLEERNTEIATLNSNVAMLQSSITDAETYRDSLLVLLEDSNTSNDELESMIETANNSIQALETDLASNYSSFGDHAILISAIISRADFSYVHFGDVQIEDSTFYRVNLSGVNLTSAHLINSVFSHLPVCPASLPNDWLCITIFDSFTLDDSGFQLIGPAAEGSWHVGTQANLSGANLDGINFWYFDFSGVNFSNANLNNADLRYSDLSNANLEGASFNLDYGMGGSAGIIYSNTTCPDGTNSDDNGNTCRNNR